jgi:hypothetical protein
MDMKQSKKYLTYVTRIILFSLVMYISCVNHTDKEKMQFPFVQEIEFDSSVNQISIENPTDSLINFRLYVNEKFWYTQEEILSAVEEIETDSLPGLPMDAAKAWVFVMENSFHYQEIYLEKEFAYQALNLFNSWGGAFCSHRNSALAQIWEWQGYQTRCIQLKGHIVSEIFYNEKWMMLDADFNTYFLNQNGLIANYTELAKSMEAFSMHSNRESQSIMNTLMQFNKTSYFKHFKGTHKNRIEPWFTEGIPEIESHITLPSKASIILPSDKQSEIGHYQTGSMQIPNQFSGKIQTPFAIISATCDTIYQENLIFQQNHINPPGNYFIEGNNIQIQFLINPIIFMNPPQYITIKKDKQRELIITTDFKPKKDVSFFQLRKALLRIQEAHPQSNFNYDSLSIPASPSIQSNEDFTKCFLQILQIESSTMPDSVNIKLSCFFDLLENKKASTKFLETLNKNKNNCIKATYLIYFLPIEYYSAGIELI